MPTQSIITTSVTQVEFFDVLEQVLRETNARLTKKDDPHLMCIAIQRFRMLKRWRAKLPRETAPAEPNDLNIGYQSQSNTFRNLLEIKSFLPQIVVYEICKDYTRQYTPGAFLNHEGSSADCEYTPTERMAVDIFTRFLKQSLPPVENLPASPSAIGQATPPTATTSGSTHTEPSTQKADAQEEQRILPSSELINNLNGQSGKKKKSIFWTEFFNLYRKHRWNKIETNERFAEWCGVSRQRFDGAKSKYLGKTEGKLREN